MLPVGYAYVLSSALLGAAVVGGAEGDFGFAGGPRCLDCPVHVVTFGENSSDTYSGVSKDTYLNFASPVDSHGNVDIVWVADDPTTALFQFDLSALPANAAVIGARLHLWNNGDESTDTLTLHEVREAWDENLGGASDAASWVDRE